MEKQAAKRNSVHIITYGQLVRSDRNVRKMETAAGQMSIAELAESIFHRGLLQNLVVVPEVKRKKETGQYQVDGGKRRHAALDLLFEQGRIAQDYPVNVFITTAESGVIDSLTENLQRESMHHADEFDAFQALINEGRSVADIATEFGYSEVTIRQRLALANVSPNLMAKFRAGEINLSQMMAFTINPDHAMQEAAWATASANINRSPEALRKLLTPEETISTAPLAEFVGVEAYVAANGPIRFDLFAEDGECFLCDTPLLQRLAQEKLEAMQQQYLADGWKWVTVSAEPANMYSAYELNAERRETTAEEQQQIDALQAEIDRLQAICDEAEEFDKVNNDKLDALTAQMDAWNVALEFWTQEQKSRSGVIVAIESHGLSIRCGVVSAEDRRAAQKEEREAAGKTEPSKPAFSEKLMMNLTAHRTAAVQAALAKRVDVALATVTNHMALVVFRHAAYRSAMTINASTPYLKSHADDIEESPAFKQLDETYKEWAKKLPKKDDAIFAWLLEQPQEEVLSLLAYCSARMINTTDANSKGLGAAEKYAKALGMDFADWWKPTAAGYFKHLSKDQIVETVKKTAGATAAIKLESMKKGQAAEEAERLLQDSRFVPSVMR